MILVIEDDPKVAGSIVLRLREAGHAAHSVRSAEEAEEHLRDPLQAQPEMVLCDVRLPGMSGIQLIRRMGEAMPPAIIISGEASMAETVEALRLGVHDFLDKPFSRERLLKSVENLLEHVALRRQVRALQREEGQDILGDSQAVRELRTTIARIAPTEARVIIRGESGTGKELVANAIRFQSHRRGRPFVKLNCAAIPSHLIEAELFGHTRGAFTDAKIARRGLFEEAHGGTLFLDEIGDMHLELQARLLRVLEDGRVRRIGESGDRAVDVRVLCATHRDLADQVRAGSFREDLFFRIAAVPIEVPPLRARREDVPLLFTAFLKQFCLRNQRLQMSVERDAMAALARYDWPGNIRELRNVAERMSVFGSDPITVEQLPTALLVSGETTEAALLRMPVGGEVMPLRDFKRATEKEYLESVLRRTGWNVTRAAELLDVQRTHLHQKMAALGIERQVCSDGADDEHGWR